MNKKKLNLLLLGSFFILFFSCSDDEIGEIKGSQSPFGEVGNEIDWKVGQFGISDANMVVTGLEGGVSTFECSFTPSDNTIVDLFKMVPTNRFPGTLNINGNTVSAKVNAKITDNGAQVIFNDGSKLTLVDYDAKVGDIYSAKVDGVTLQNEVVERSTEDDYYWGGMYIKVITVRYKSQTPGVSHVDAFYNHKFALVGLALTFEDGSLKYAGIEF